VFQWTINNPPCTPSTSTVTITVTAFVDATITDVSPVCVGSGTFNMNAVTSGGTWTGTGITSGAAGTFDPALAGAGTYTITYTISGSCGSVDTSVVTVTPNSNPAITAPSSLCSSAAPVTLSAATGGGTWTGAGITNASTGAYDPSVAGIGADTVIYTIPGGCGAADTVVINISSVSDPSISALLPVCAGSPAFNIGAATPGGTWSGTGITNTSAGTFDPSVSGTGTFTIIYTISGACGAADTAGITVTNAANATITAVTPVCAGSAPFNLSAATPGGTWSGTGITDPVNGTFDPSVAGTSTVTYSIGGSCGDTATQNITVNALPAPGFSSDISSGCGVACATFTESVSATCASLSYNFGDGSTSTSSGPVHCFTGPASYDVTLSCTDANGCTGSITIPNMITVNTLPAADFSASPSIAAPGTPVVFTNSSSGAAAYSWNFDDPASGSNTSTLSNDSHTYASEGTYCVTLVAVSSANCPDTIVKCIVVADEATLFIPNVFTPNGDGNNDIFFVTSNSVKELNCSIYDRWGLKIAQWTSTDDSPNGWDGRTTSGVPATDGTYYYIIHAKTLNEKEINTEGYLQLLKAK
jgi:gliding motility-associated-like protein